MMAKWTLPVLCLVGMILLLLPEFLAPAQRDSGPPFAGGPAMDWWITSMDKNEDGQVTLAEAQSEHPGLTVENFKFRDFNGDGVWTSEDRWRGFRSLTGRRRIEDIDKNLDGKVSMDEYTAASQEEFKVLDLDADGGIVQEEWPRRFWGGPGMAGVRPWGIPLEGPDGGPPPGPPPGVPGEASPPGFTPEGQLGANPLTPRT